MHKSLYILLLFVSTLFYAQQKVSHEKKVESLIQIWGLLKYKHPNVSKGKFDINQEFLKEYQKIKSISSQRELDLEFIRWIKSFKSLKNKTNPKPYKSKNLFTKNEGYSWISNSNYCIELTQLLNNLKMNTNHGDYYASVNKLSSTIEFKNDNELIGFDEKLEGHRILFLASFWNKMRYWNVNIYLTETKWNEVLQLMVPEFLKSEVSNFKIAKDKLFASLNDSHANYNFSPIYRDIKRKYSLYGGRIINDTLVIKTIFNKNLAQKENIELGDMIYKINGKTLKEYYTLNFGDRISTSNHNHLKSILENYYLLSDAKDSLNVSIVKKDGSSQTQNIKLYKYNKKNYKPIAIVDTLSKQKWLYLRNNVGYINLKNTNTSDLKEAFKSFKNKKGIIIDLRNYPVNIKATDIPNYTYPKKKVFMKILTSTHPSLGNYDTQSALKIVKNPFAAGRNNKSYYKGRIILLVNRKTGSMAEYFAMAIQASPNCFTVGEQTFGAVMNRNEIVLKDATTIDYTSIGAFYPDDTNVQRVGLKIDKYINESALNYSIYKYVDEALQIIEKE